MLTKEISATLSDKNKAEIKQAITTIQDNLAFLISLTPEERRKRPKMGKKSLAFVRDSVTVTQTNPEVVPSNFDSAEFARDYQLTADLTEVLILLEQLTEKVDDTLLAVGSESMMSSLLVYDYVKTAARHSPGLKSVAEQLGERFKSMGRRGRRFSTEDAA